MRVLIACKFSGAVRDAFTTAGHDATSCDLLPSETAGQHHQGDVFALDPRALRPHDRPPTMHAPLRIGRMLVAREGPRAG